MNLFGISGDREKVCGNVLKVRAGEVRAWEPAQNSLNSADDPQKYP